MLSEIFDVALSIDNINEFEIEVEVNYWIEEDWDNKKYICIDNIITTYSFDFEGMTYYEDDDVTDLITDYAILDCEHRPNICNSWIEFFEYEKHLELNTGESG